MFQEVGEQMTTDPFGNRLELLQPTSACTVRRLCPDDAEAWAVLRREALEAHPLAFGASVPDDPKLLVESGRTRLAPGGESTVFGAFIDVSLVGIVGIVRNAGRKERHKSQIWGMYVTAGSRRTGAGQMLLRAAIEQARSWTGVEQVHLAVSEVATEARRLYERNGFQAWGREPRALSLDGRYADESHMILDLRK
jgi:RimJ/RimL family protein N-acetyltransferase